MRVYGQPHRAGGASNAGDIYVRRAADGDPTLLHDALGVAIDVLTDIRRDVLEHMDDTEPTKAKPGSAAKVEEMRRRAESGRGIFNEDDRQVD